MSRPVAGLLSEIETRAEKFRESERKAAECVLAAPKIVLRQSLAGLATTAGVSEPTAIRFCRGLDCSGFSDFKIRLAQSLASGHPTFTGRFRRRRSDHRRQGASVIGECHYDAS